MQLSFVLEGIMCQSLLPRMSGRGRSLAMEILIPNAAIRNLIREDKVHQVYGMMQAGQAKHGMQTFNQSLAQLYFKRMITLQVAMARPSHPDELQEIINRGPSGRPVDRQRAGGRQRQPPETIEGYLMPNFVWKGKARTGQLQQGVLLADSRNAAVATLRRQQIQVTSIKEQSRQIPLMPRLPVRVPRKRLAIFTRQFSVMLDAGLPLVQCLEILGSQEDNRHFKEIIRQVRIDVESGARSPTPCASIRRVRRSLRLDDRRR